VGEKSMLVFVLRAFVIKRAKGRENLGILCRMG
jgi:hypothetical protein